MSNFFSTLDAVSLVEFYSAPEHAIDMIQKPADRASKTKIYTNQNFQFHFYYRVMSELLSRY